MKDGHPGYEDLNSLPTTGRRDAEVLSVDAGGDHPESTRGRHKGHIIPFPMHILYVFMGASSWLAREIILDM